MADQNQNQDIRHQYTYYAEKYKEMYEKTIEKLAAEFESKNISKYFDTKNLSQYDLERFKIFTKQFSDHYKNHLRDEIEKFNRKNKIDEILSQIFELRQRKIILSEINSSELKKDITGQFSSYDLEKNIYDTIHKQLEQFKLELNEKKNENKDPNIVSK